MRSFLVQESALGTSRAACVAALLKELNDSVAGAYVEEEPAQLLASDPAFFKEFSLVIATQVRARAPKRRSSSRQAQTLTPRRLQMREEQLLALDAVCREYGVALIMARSYGLVGHVRISVAVRHPPP